MYPDSTATFFCDLCSKNCPQCVKLAVVGMDRSSEKLVTSDIIHDWAFEKLESIIGAIANESYRVSNATGSRNSPETQGNSPNQICRKLASTRDPGEID